MAWRSLWDFINRFLRLSTGPRTTTDIPVDFGWHAISKSWGWLQENGRLGTNIQHPKRPVVLKSGEAFKLIIDRLEVSPNEKFETCYVELVNIKGTDATGKFSTCKFELNGQALPEQTVCIPAAGQPATSHFVDMVLPGDPNDPHYDPNSPKFKPNARNEVLIHNKGPHDIPMKTLEVFMARARS